MKTKKPKLDVIESVPYISTEEHVNTQQPQKKTVVKMFYNESDLADFLHDHEDYVIISVFSNEGHITGIFMSYE